MPSASSSAVPCGRPGCNGTIDDGYCDACGLAQAGAAPSSAFPDPTGSSRTGTSPSGRTPSTRSARSAHSTRSTRSGSTRSGRTARALGGIALARPPLPPQDPFAVLIAPEVPDRKRFCSSCDAKLNREGGFCPKCGQAYSFKATLVPGDIVAAKYEVKGTIAFGGLGWIYLALDTVLSRWVILKGLLNAMDPSMIAVAVKEREFLAAVKHPKIVGIYDFVTHAEQGFIVMEFVNGRTLMRLRKDRGGPLPVAEAISYVVEILPAFQYLDDAGLVYCDFKPENAMVEEDTVKLIDMGAVRAVDDATSDVYGSKGYTAPEAHDAPTPISDLYSVARALAVLVADFDFQGKYEKSLPPAADVAVFARDEALYRFLAKATRAAPQHRFQSAAEMAEQLVGVLRHVADAGEVPRIDSEFFDPDSDGGIASTSHEGHDGIPRLKVDRSDAAASVILAAGAVGDPVRRLAMFERALQQHPGSMELALRRIDELVSTGRFADAERFMAEVQKAHPDDWRLAWYRGRALLAQGKTAETLAEFEQILDEMPGEVAPRQAVARAYEAGGHLDEAVRYYDAVARADASFTGAAFGLARCLERKGDRPGAADAYRLVPSTSSRFVAAQLALARLLLRGDGSKVTLDEMRGASEAIEAIAGQVEGVELHELRAEALVTGARLAEGGLKAKTHVLGLPLRPKMLRRAAEEELRACARLAVVESERIRWIDEANRVRPVTWL
ncbi:MAG TPA: tetratricopeptide repeat protein [Polyangiaceae bacterium]